MKKILIVFTAFLTALSVSGCMKSSAKSDAEETTDFQEASQGEEGAEAESTDEKENEKLDAEESKSADTEESKSEEKSQEGAKETEELLLPQLDEPQKGDLVAAFKTSFGDIKVRLFPEYAPKAVENFTTHAKDGYYDGLTFHRVINDFMIQGGDPVGNGTGGESIWGLPFEDEITPSLRNFRGALSMANSGADTNGSQFFIVQNPQLDESTMQAYKNALTQQEEVLETDADGNDILLKDLYPVRLLNEYIQNGGSPHLDGSYTVFGQVYEGMDVVDKIAAVDVDENDKPLDDVIIETITVGEY